MTTSLTRLSLFRPVGETTKADAITQQLIGVISSGMLKNGERLPGESEMAKLFAVAPITIRDSLEQLRAQGFIETRRGRDGGSFITSNEQRNFRYMNDCLAHMSTFEIKNHRALYMALISSSARIMTRETTASEREEILESMETLVDALQRQTAQISQQSVDLQSINDKACFIRGHQEAQIHADIAIATQSPHLVDDLVGLQNMSKHLLSLRFCDMTQVESLIKDYAEAAQLLRTNQDQRFEQQITAIVFRGFQWLLERRSTLRLQAAQRVATTVENGSPAWRTSHDGTVHVSQEDAADRMSSLMAVYGRKLTVWSARLNELLSSTVLDKQSFEQTSLELVHPLLMNDKTVIGAGIVPSQALLSGATWHSFWWTSKWVNGAEQPLIEPLQISDNPQSASFYDVTSQEWWKSSQAAQTIHISGPYVDYICSNQFTLTLSTALLSDQNFNGVVGIDLSAALFEQQVEDILFRLDRPALLLGCSQRIIASTCEELLSGDIVDNPAALHPTSVIDCPFTGDAVRIDSAQHIRTDRTPQLLVF